MTSAQRRWGRTAAAPRPLALSWWLLLVAALVFLIIVVGGITRLTESGLSIVEWKPVRGIIPPLNAEQWQAEFAAYQAIPQYIELNAHMTLEGFKQIYFWEYVHRLLARAIGLVLALVALAFWWRGTIPQGYGRRIIIILLLGGLQGAIGWWMVTSGLQYRTEVSHIRLAIHLMAALLIFAVILWTVFDLRALARDPAARPARLTGVGAMALTVLSVQIMYGAFTAGLRAGYAFSSWPKMGADWFPANTPMLDPAWLNLFDNPIVVQFIHRWVAFAAAAALGVLAMRAAKRGGRPAARAVAALLLVQILLGIATLLSGVRIDIAVAHQAVAALLLAASVASAHALGRYRVF